LKDVAMSEPLRTAKTLAEWEELDYFRRPRAMRRLKVWVSLLTLVGVIVLCGAFFAPGGKRLLQAGPLSLAHSRYTDQCDLCHTESLKTVKRMFNVHDSSVSDQACTQCHYGPAHNTRQAFTPACASCHREHRGQEALARMDDSHCIDCHADLKVKEGQAAPAHPHIRDFGADHPYGSTLAKGDPGTITFTHQKHLQVWANMPTTGFTPERITAHKDLQQKQCQYCHKPEADGRYMQPIRYEQNCKICHPLTAPVPDVGTDKELQAAADTLRLQGVPHPAPGQTAAVSLGAVRVNFQRFVADHPAVLKPVTGQRPRPLPGRGEDADPSNQRAPAEWVEAQVKTATGQMRSQSGCVKCHQVATPAGGQGTAFLDVQPAAITRNWLPKSNFNHAKHPMLQCVACHDKALSSNNSKDVMIPGTVESCVQCHNKHESVRSDCLTCHGYHPTTEKRSYQGKMSVQEFLHK
jgi:hypothetical protein